jgi:hypothetical protein
VAKNYEKCFFVFLLHLLQDVDEIWNRNVLFLVVVLLIDDLFSAVSVTVIHNNEFEEKDYC